VFAEPPPREDEAGWDPMQGVWLLVGGLVLGLVGAWGMTARDGQWICAVVMGAGGVVGAAIVFVGSALQWWVRVRPAGQPVHWFWRAGRRVLRLLDQVSEPLLNGLLAALSGGGDRRR
jgi:hypothetical protein